MGTAASSTSPSLPCTNGTSNLTYTAYTFVDYGKQPTTSTRNASVSRTNTCVQSFKPLAALFLPSPPSTPNESTIFSMSPCGSASRYLDDNEDYVLRPVHEIFDQDLNQDHAEEAEADSEVCEILRDSICEPLTPPRSVSRRRLDIRLPSTPARKPVGGRLGNPPALHRRVSNVTDLSDILAGQELEYCQRPQSRPSSPTPDRQVSRNLQELVLGYGITTLSMTRGEVTGHTSKTR
jgi:hypothetical protein